MYVCVCTFIISPSHPTVLKYSSFCEVTFSDKPLASSLRKRKQLMTPLVKDNDDDDEEPKTINKTNKSKRQGRRGNREEEEDSAKAIKMRGLKDTRTPRSNSCEKITSLPSVGSFFTSSSIVETTCVEEISLPTKLQQGQVPQQGRNCKWLIKHCVVYCETEGLFSIDSARHFWSTCELAHMLICCLSISLFFTTLQVDDIIEALRSGGEFSPQTASTFTLNDKKTNSELHIKYVACLCFHTV